MWGNFAADLPLEEAGFEPSVPRKRTLFETAPFELAFPMPREGPRLRISVPPPPSVAEGILTRPSSFTPIGRPPICDWPEQETKLRRLSHPMDPRTAPLYVPREDREHVTNAHCIADVDDKV